MDDNTKQVLMTVIPAAAGTIGSVVGVVIIWLQIKKVQVEQAVQAAQSAVLDKKVDVIHNLTNSMSKELLLEGKAASLAEGKVAGALEERASNTAKITIKAEVLGDERAKKAGE